MTTLIQTLRGFALLAALAGAPLAAETSAAQEGAAVTGANVLERCTAKELPTVNWCMGFILGVGTVASDMAVDPRYRVCFPPDTDFDAARRTVVEQLTDSDALRDVSGTHAVWYALKKTFGCPGP